MTLRPLFALAPGCLDALHVSGTFRAIFSPVGAWAEQCPADGTTLGVQPIKQGCFQFLVQRQQQGKGQADIQVDSDWLNNLLHTATSFYEFTVKYSCKVWFSSCK